MSISAQKEFVERRRTAGSTHRMREYYIESVQGKTFQVKVEIKNESLFRKDSLRVSNHTANSYCLGGAGLLGGGGGRAYAGPK